MAVAARVAVVPNMPVQVNINKVQCPGRRNSKAKRNASVKEKLCLETEEILKAHMLGCAQGSQYSAIHQCCLKVVKDHEAMLLQLCKKLKPSRDSLYSNFMKVFGTLFSEGITVGKIVTSIAFGGKLVKYCSENGLDVTDNLIAWTLDYFKNYLSDWILNYGGWEKIEQKLADGDPPKIQWSGLLLDTLTLSIMQQASGLFVCCDTASHYYLQGHLIDHLKGCVVLLLNGARGLFTTVGQMESSQVRR